MSGLCDVKSGFLGNLKYGPMRWILPSHHPPAG